MENNHGKVGEALYLKFTPMQFYNLTGKMYKHGTILNEEINASVPIHIDETTKGNYECICEFGVEVY